MLVDKDSSKKRKEPNPKSTRSDKAKEGLYRMHVCVDMCVLCMCMCIYVLCYLLGMVSRMMDAMQYTIP